MPQLMLHGQAADKSVNLIPFFTLTPEDIKTSLLNILLFVPFGFGLPFVTSFRLKRIVLVGSFFSFGIEFVQFITGYIAHTTFRIADINDVIFNTLGVAGGYMAFMGLVGVFRHTFYKKNFPINPLLRYMMERPQIKRTTSKTI